jgi:hypothetical protein
MSSSGPAFVTITYHGLSVNLHVSRVDLPMCYILYIFCDMITETSTVAGQRLDKHLSAATDTHATIEELLDTVFSMRSVPRLYS